MKKNNNSEPARRKLIFISHSKAEDQSPEISDFERSLTTRGKVTAMLMARIMMDKGEHPGPIISSPAFRALEPALIFGKEFGVSADEIKLVPELYLNMNENDFLRFIRQQDDSFQTITLFGHNPLITDMAAYFAADEPESLSKAGIYCLEFHVSGWAEVEPESGRTIYYLTPKDL